MNQYYIDTEMATLMFKENPNPKEQSIKIDGEEYNLEYIIVPQGKMILEKEIKVDYLKERDVIRTENKLVKASVGQKLINGLNMALLLNNETKISLDKTQAIFLKNDKLYNYLRDRIKEVFSYLSDSLKADFKFSAVNVKPFFDRENKKVTLVITDLARSLGSYYRNSPKFEELRKQADK